MGRRPTRRGSARAAKATLHKAAGPSNVQALINSCVWKEIFCRVRCKASSLFWSPYSMKDSLAQLLRLRASSSAQLPKYPRFTERNGPKPQHNQSFSIHLRSNSMGSAQGNTSLHTQTWKQKAASLLEPKYFGWDPHAPHQTNGFSATLGFSGGEILQVSKPWKAERLVGKEKQKTPAAQGFHWRAVKSWVCILDYLKLYRCYIYMSYDYKMTC